MAYFEGVTLLAKTRNDPEIIRQLTEGALRLAGAKATPAASSVSTSATSPI